MNSIVYTITQEITLSGYKIQALDESVTDLYLRRYENDGTYIEEITGVNIGTAKFRFDCPDGNYQMWKSAYPNVTGSNRIDAFAGGSGKYRWIGDNALNYLTKVTDISGTYYECNGLELRSPIATILENTSLISGAEADSRYIASSELASLINETDLAAAFVSLLASNKLIFPQMTDGALDQNIYATWTFRDSGAIPYILATPTSPFHAATVKFVKDYVNNYLTGQITFQQTETIIIIDFDCTQEDNRRYFSITGAIAAANAYADAGTRVTMFIEGGNVDNLTADGNLAYMLLPNTSADYVDVVGISECVWISLNDTAYATATVGKKVIQNITLSNPASSSTTFSKYIFRNVKFVGVNPSSAIAFTDCIFENCSKDSTVAITTSNCIGEIFDISNSQKLIFNTVKDSGGAYEIAYANGDIQGKRQLGRKGASTIASADDLTLLEGNYFWVSGTHNVWNIITTGWTSGSVIRLLFTGLVPVKVNQGGSNLVRVGGGDFTATVGKVYTLILDSSNWIFIE